MPIGMEVGLGVDTLCYMGTELRPHKGHSSPHPILGPCLLWANGWMDQDVTSYGGRPQRRQHYVRWHVGLQIARRFEPSIVLWAFHTIQPPSSAFKLQECQ